MQNLDLFHYLKDEAIKNKTFKYGAFPVINDTHDIQFLEEGHVLEYYLLDGETKTVSWFWGPGEFIMRSSGLSQIEAMDDLKLISLSSSNISQMSGLSSEFNKDYRSVRSEHSQRIKQRVNDLKILSAVERYGQLLKTKPWVFEIGTEEDIASYLRVPVSKLRSFRNNKD
ncbi:cyclic nucleotide-binding domain-containing protein [Flavitalea flava]